MWLSSSIKRATSTPMSSSEQHATSPELALGPKTLRSVSDVDVPTGELIATKIKSLQATFEKMVAAQSSLAGWENSNVLHVADPVTGKLVVVAHTNISSIVNHVIPKAFETLRSAEYVRPVVVKEEEGELRHKQRSGVIITDLSEAPFLLTHTSYCNLQMTGEVTADNINKPQQYQKMMAPGKHINRVLRGDTGSRLDGAAHWHKSDPVSSEFIVQWMEVSHLLVEFMHAVAVELHLLEAIQRLDMYATDNYPLGPLSPCTAKQLEFVRACYTADASAKKLHNKSNRFDMKKREHCGLLFEYAQTNMTNMYMSLLEKDGKDRTIQTPFRMDKNQESIIQFTNKLTFNTVKGHNIEPKLQAAWEEVIKHEFYKFHRDMQYYKPTQGSADTVPFEGPYPFKGVGWSRALYLELKDKFWPAINEPMAGAITEFIKMSVLPSKNDKIALLDSRGDALRSPTDGGTLTTFEACAAFSKLSNNKYHKNSGDNAIVLIGVKVRQDMKHSSNYYGTVETIQPLLDSKFVSDVTRGVWWKGHPNEGMATAPPTLTMPFDNKDWMRDYMRSSKATEVDPFDTDRHDAFVSYDHHPEPQTTEIHQSPPQGEPNSDLSSPETE